eukprot:jgi/Chlat1/4527/Chrsp29S04588
MLSLTCVTRAVTACVVAPRFYNSWYRIDCCASGKSALVVSMYAMRTTELSFSTRTTKIVHDWDLALSLEC